MYSIWSHFYLWNPCTAEERVWPQDHCKVPAQAAAVADRAAGGGAEGWPGEVPADYLPGHGSGCQHSVQLFSLELPEGMSLVHSFISSFIHPSIHPSIHPTIHPTHLSIHPSIHSSNHTQTLPTHPPFHSLILLSIHQFIHFSLYSLINSSTHPSIQSPTHPSIHSLVHLFISLFINSSTHPTPHPSIHPLTHPSIHSLVHSFVSPSTHQTIHPSIHWFMHTSIPSVSILIQYFLLCIFTCLLIHFFISFTHLLIHLNIFCELFIYLTRKCNCVAVIGVLCFLGHLPFTAHTQVTDGKCGRWHLSDEWAENQPQNPINRSGRWSLRGTVWYMHPQHQVADHASTRNKIGIMPINLASVCG